MPKSFIHSRQASTFDGSTEHVSMGDVLDQARTDAFTVWIWFKANAIASSSYLVSKFDDSTKDGWGLYVTSTGSIRWFLESASGTQVDEIETDGAFDNDRWHLAVAVSAGTGSGGMSIYVDGIPVPTTVNSSTLGSNPITNNADFMVGARDTPTGWFTGTIDEPGLASKALSQAEILELWNGGIPPDVRVTSFYGPAVLDGGGAWRAGDGDSTSTWTDVTGKNDGTTTGFAAANYVNDVPYRSYLNVLSTVFDGTDDTVSMGDVAELEFDNADAFSVSCWFKTSVNSGFIFSKQENSGNFRGYALSLGVGSGDLAFQVINTNSSNHARLDTSGLTLADGEWHHVVVTKSTGQSVSGGDFNIYVDGVAPSTSAGTDNLSATTVNAEPFRFGAVATTAASFFTGRITQGAVFDSELTSTEAAELFDNGPVDIAKTSVWPDCVGYWHLGACDTGTSGALTTAIDQTVSGNDGTAAGSPVLAIDVPTGGHNDLYGVALDLDGTSQYVDVGDVAAWQFTHTDAFSLECWFRQPGTVVTGTDTIVGKADATTPFQGYRVYMDTGEDIIWELRNGSSNAAVIRTSNTIVDQRWHHLVVTYDGSTDASGMTIYLDGAVRPSTVSSDTLTATIAHAVALQWGASDGANFFPGPIMGCAVYDVELTVAQVMNHFQTGPANLSTADASADLQGWWPTGHGDQGDVVVACDYSINMNHGTLSGTDAGYGQYNSADAPPPPLSAWRGPSQDLVTEANTRDRQVQQVLGGSTASENRNLVIGDLSAGPVSIVSGGVSGTPAGIPAGDGGGGQPAETVFYTMRGRDDGVSAPGYVVWSVQDEPDWDGSQATSGNTSPPLVGSVIANSSVVINQT